MKVALVHDFLVKLGGAERVLKVFSEMFPEADIFTLLYDEEVCGEAFAPERVNCSFLQKYPGFLRRRYRYLLGKMPRAIEELNLEGYDLVISSSNAYAHGVITDDDCVHINYCHSPMRYAWDFANEVKKINNISGLKAAYFAKLMKEIREWDFLAAQRCGKMVANSKNVARRIAKYYRRDSEVIYPPVDVEKFKCNKEKGDYFLIVSTLAAYKKVDLAVKLFNKIGKRLVIIGDGAMRKDLEAMACDNIDFLGFKNDEVVKEYLENCRAFIFPGEEDFGMAPVEAMACGKPVLAYGKGGLLESVVAGKTGEFFYEESVESMEDGLGRLINNEQFYQAKDIAAHAKKFSRKNFEKAFKELLKKIGR